MDNKSKFLVERVEESVMPLVRTVANYLLEGSSKLDEKDLDAIQCLQIAVHNWRVIKKEAQDQPDAPTISMEFTSLDNQPVTLVNTENSKLMDLQDRS